VRIAADFAYLQASGQGKDADQQVASGRRESGTRLGSNKSIIA
jgi:hypothetical protein